MKKESLVSFADNLDFTTKFEAAQQNTEIMGSVALEMSKDIQKKRIQIFKDAIAKENSLKGEYHKAMNVKPEPARYAIIDGERVEVQPATFSDTQLDSMKKDGTRALENYNRLSKLLTDCSTIRFEAPEGTEEEIAAAKKAFVKADTERWNKLEKAAKGKANQNNNQQQKQG